MCDYSLTLAESRPAVEGERLLVHRFRNDICGFVAEIDLLAQADSRQNLWARIKRWLAWDGELCAVCVEPGTQLILRDIPATMRLSLHVRAEELVAFVSASLDEPYRDAVRFGNGVEVLIQNLPIGMVADVVSALPDPICFDWAEEPVNGEIVLCGAA